MMVNLPCLMVSRTNFLRPTCSYTECQLSFQTGSLPYGEKFCQLQLLFVFDFYWPSSYFKKTVFSGRSSLFHLLVLLECSASHTPSVYRFLIQNPAGFLSNLLFLCYLYALLIWSYNISQHLSRIILCPFSQNCINYSQYLTGYHYKRLQLF